MQNNFVTLGCPGKLTSGPWHGTTHWGVPWTTAYAQRNPSVCTLRANQLNVNSEVTQKNWQSGFLHAAPGSASGSSWFCIRLLLCFRRKQSCGIYQIRGKSSIRITGMEMPLSKHDWWTVSSIFIIPDWSMKPLLLNRRVGFSLHNFS